MKASSAHRSLNGCVLTRMTLATLALLAFGWIAAMGPVIVFAATAKKVMRPDHSYLWVMLAFLVSAVAESARLMGYQVGLEWAVSNLYPIVQLGLFGAAVGGLGLAVLASVTTTFITSIEITVGSIVEPTSIARVAGSLIVGAYALNWRHRLRPTVFLYCVGGALTWLLWLPYMEVRGLANLLGYLAYQSTRIGSFGLFIRAAYQPREA